MPPPGREMTAEEFLAHFAPAVVERLEKLEELGVRIEEFLFKGKDGHQSLEQIAYAVNRHVTVWCQYAALADRALKFTAHTLKRVAILLAAVVAILTAGAALLHFFGLGTAAAQSLRETGSFSEYARSVWGSRIPAHFGVLLFFGLLGVCGHYLWQWLTDRISGSLWVYLAKDHPKRTLASFACIAGWAVVTVDPALTWSATINLALSTGFAIDVLVNKASPPAAKDVGAP